MKTTRTKVEIKEKPAGEQIYAWAVCGNFPKERAGLEALAESLQRAAMDSGIMMSAIVEECIASSAWCPTPYDLRQVAVGMKLRAKEKKLDNRREHWERIYGPPNPEYAQAILSRISGPNIAAEKVNLNREAIRAMLFYTEGEGREMGDRKYWEAARASHTVADVAVVRTAGGWRTERELDAA